MTLANAEMKEGRFLSWHQNRTLVAKINTSLELGHTVQLTTYTQATRYTRKHLGMFKATKSGAYVQRGKRWDCINGCNIRAYAYLSGDADDKSDATHYASRRCPGGATQDERRSRSGVRRVR